VIVLTVLAAVVAGGFLVAVLNANPYTKWTSS
jgi:hypothetical protein